MSCHIVTYIDPTKMATTSDVGVLVNACFQVQCDKCGKMTWKGCGRHVDSVMKDVKEEDKCVCPR